MSSFDSGKCLHSMHSSLSDAIEGLCYNQCIIGLRQWLGVLENQAESSFSAHMESLSQLSQDFRSLSFDLKKLFPIRHTFQVSLPSPLGFFCVTLQRSRSISFSMRVSSVPMPSKSYNPCHYLNPRKRTMMHLFSVSGSGFQFIMSKIMLLLGFPVYLTR